MSKKTGGLTRKLGIHMKRRLREAARTGEGFALAAGLLGCTEAPERRFVVEPPAADLAGVPTVPEGCKGAAGEALRASGDVRGRLICARAFYRRGCALGASESCARFRQVDARLLQFDTDGQRQR